MNPIGENRYALIAHGHCLLLEQKAENLVELSCSEGEYEALWRNYFDMDYDYGQLIECIEKGNDGFLKKAASFGRGIRILRQDFFETMISFIISQNKNIPSIKHSIECLSRRYGEQHYCAEADITYYTFPTPEALAASSAEELRTMSVGYRDAYILSAARAVTMGQLDTEKIRCCSYEEAKKALLCIHGIGEKVANCICLYGLHQIEVFPVDVWIKRILSEIYEDCFCMEKFDGKMGIVQQYMFYYMRSRDKR
jgi:N-glycosylase/DNA lyase